MDASEQHVDISSKEVGINVDGSDTNSVSHTDDRQDEKEHPNTTWTLASEVYQQKQVEDQSNLKHRELGVTWRNLSADVIASESAVNETVLSQFNMLQHIKESRHKAPLRRILDNSNGCVKPGEMLLVLGRPGSGCTTLLKLLSNHRHSFKSVEGDVRFGSMTADEATYRGQIVMNSEEEVFFPALTVGQTMDFATRLKTPFRLPNGTESPEEYRKAKKHFLLESMGISHTHDTKVGNEFVRGVSGGERKRVSIIECLASRASVFCWDNSTRGLDASNALEWTRAIRAMTDILGLTTIATLYQAGNGIFNLFDKVLVLDEGKQVYYGPMKEAQPFMESLGFVCRDGSNVGDFLSGVTVPTERLIRPGYENIFPRTADSLRETYEKSTIAEHMASEFNYPDTELAQQRTEEFKEAVAEEKSNRLPKSSPWTVSFPQQVMTCVRRQYYILWGDKTTFIMKQVFTIIQALIAGSLFYDAPDNSGGLFIKSGAVFFSLLYNSLLAMSEVTDSFAGRPVLIKHKDFAFFHPAAFCIAQITSDIPVILFQISVFGLVVYFMVGLTVSASAFFTYWIVIFANTMVSLVFVLYQRFFDSPCLSASV